MTWYAVHTKSNTIQFSIADDTRLPNCHWRKDRCKDGRRKEKIGFATKQEAKANRKKMHRNYLKVYQCPLCGQWHLGNK